MVDEIQCAANLERSNRGVVFVFHPELASHPVIEERPRKLRRRRHYCVDTIRNGFDLSQRRQVGHDLSVRCRHRSASDSEVCRYFLCRTGQVTCKMAIGCYGDSNPECYLLNTDPKASVVPRGDCLTRFLEKTSGPSKSSEMYPLGQLLGNIPSGPALAIRQCLFFGVTGRNPL